MNLSLLVLLYTRADDLTLYSGKQSGHNTVISHTQFKVVNAAQTMASFSLTSDKVGGTETIPTRLLPITELKAVATTTKTVVEALPAKQKIRSSLYLEKA